MRTGQYIFESQAIPREDIFSYTSVGKPWITHEWLSALLLFVVFQFFGYAGDVIFTASIVTLSFFIIYGLCLKLGINELMALFLLVWGAILILIFFTVRPLIFTWLFFSIFLSSVYLYHRRLSSWLWHLPPLMMLWVNLHGGFAIGIVLIGILIIARFGEGIMKKRPFEIGHPLIVLILCGLATVVNPNGLDGLMYPLTYTGSANPSMQLITEWQSPDFHRSYSLLLLASFLLFMAIGVVHRGLRSWPVLVLALLVTMTLQSTRHIPLYALSFAPIAGESLKNRIGTPGWLERQKIQRSLGRLNWLILICLTGTVITVAILSPLSQLHKIPLLSGGISYPVEGVEYIKNKHPQARIFNQYMWGGYLIYTLFPKQQVFIDGRVDVHGQELIQEYVDVVDLKPNWEDILDRYQVDLVLIKKDSGLSTLLIESPYWEKEFTGQVEDIFIRKGTSE